jgi:magnesium transporter
VLRVHDPAGGLVAATAIPDRGWVHVIAPDARERELLHAAGISAEFLRHALDLHELARVAHEEHSTLIVLRVPHAGDDGHRSVTVGIVTRGNLLVTIAPVPVGVIDQLSGKADLAEAAPFRRFLELVLLASAEFLNRVNETNDGVERLERKLQSSQGNAEVMALLDHQKALVHLEQALASNELMLERLLEDERCDVKGRDRELLGDAIVEVRQALQMARISAEILSGMMDAFASIISNNLNVVLKVLAALTVVVAIPGVIAGLWGMNVPVPWAQRGWAFLAISGGAVAVSVLVALVLAAKKWF